MVSQVESFLCPDKQRTPKKGWRIQRPKRCVSTNNHKNEDSSLKNNNQNNTYIKLHLKNSGIYIYIYANFIKHNRHFMSTYFLLDPFEFPYYFYCILGELIYVLSIVACIPSTFCPTLGHHQGRIYYKSDVTFVLAYYNCVRASLPLKVLAFVFECDSIFSASS